MFVDDLPKTATGKLQRFKVRGMVAGDPQAQPATTTVREALEATS